MIYETAIGEIYATFEVDKVRRIVSICLSSDSNTSDSNKQMAICLQQIG